MEVFIVIFQNNLASEHITYSQIEQEIRDIKHKNQLLDERIIEASSLKVIERKARKNGMIDAEVIYL